MHAYLGILGGYHHFEFASMALEVVVWQRLHGPLYMEIGSDEVRSRL